MNIIKKRIRRLKMRIKLFMSRFKKQQHREDRGTHLYIYEEPKE